MLVRRKPTVTEAIQFNKNWEEIEKFIGEQNCDEGDDKYFTLYLEHEGSWVDVERYTWIIKDIDGTFYPCVDSIFQQTYEVLDQTGLLEVDELPEVD